MWYNSKMSTTIENVESTILARVMCVDTPSLPEPIARELLKWGFSEDDRSRMSDLASRARAGTLTAEEIAETEAYERVSSFLGLVKSKARQSLNARTNS